MKLSPIAAVIVGLLLGSMAPAVAAPAASATAASEPDAPSAAWLTMTGSGQQRWQSLPKSRIVLNPFDRYASGVQKSTSEVDQNSGPQLPMTAAYYSNDEAHRFPRLMSTYRAVEAGDQVDVSTPLQPLSDANGWAVTNVDVAAAAQGGAAVTVRPGSTYGRITKTLSVDLEATRYLSVSVDALSTGAVWSVEIDGKKLLPADATLVGTNVYDLGALTGKSGTQSIEVKLWVAGGAGKTATFGGAALVSNPGTNPARDKKVLWRDEFSTADGWSTGSEAGALSSTGAQGVVKIEGSGKTWGSVRKDITVDVTATTKLAIDVGALSHKWALNAWVGGSEIKLQTDSTATGWIVLNDFASRIGTGEKTISLRLFTTGARPSAVSFDEMVLYDDAVAAPWKTITTGVADEYETTWSPSVETFSASYGAAGTLTGRDVFASTDAVVREVDATALGEGSIVIAGGVAGTAQWDADAHTLTVRSPNYVQVYALPTDAVVGFGSSVAGATADTPDAATAFWTATVPAGTLGRVSVAFAPVSSSATYGLDLTVEAGIAAATSHALSAQSLDLDDRIAELDAQWDAYLAKVPVIEDFSLHGVDVYGVTEAQTAAAYYRAFVNLQQNVIPATPETNSLSAQLGTGKASTWMSGIPGAKNVATWDTLVGLQVLAYADPDTAWESFGGIMDFVQPEGSAFSGEITNDPAKGGEVLPSRKAQTAWVLYNATGDRAELERIYPALTRVLRFGATNLHWTVKDRGIYNDTQRDSEFVTSLIVDLGYAKKISALLGHTADIATWDAIDDHLTEKFDGWFVRTDGIFQQKVTLASDDDDAPVVSSTSANGNPSVVAASLAMPRLSDRARAAIAASLGGAWKGGAGQFSGLADALKGPNMNYIVTGLLDNDHIDDGESRAATFANTIVRDVVRAGWFAEVYATAGNGTSDRPVVDGVRPSLFGIATFVDALWLNNGFRVSAGDPALVRLTADSAGGVRGLTSLGRTLDVRLTADAIEVRGPAVGPEAVVRLDADTGETVVIPAENRTPEHPGDTVTTLTLRGADEEVNDSARARPAAAAALAAPPAHAGAIADVSVSVGGGAAAQGQVEIVEADRPETVLASAVLAGGAASVSVPDGLSVGSHRLVARFVPLNGLWWQGSLSDEVSFVVPEPQEPTTPGGGTTTPGGGSATDGGDSASAGGAVEPGPGHLSSTGAVLSTVAIAMVVALLGAGIVILLVARRRRDPVG